MTTKVSIIVSIYTGNLDIIFIMDLLTLSPVIVSRPNLFHLAFFSSFVAVVVIIKQAVKLLMQ